MVTEADIASWANRAEARFLLPVLVRRLVHETTPPLTVLRFPGHEAVALPGVDGCTEAIEGNQYVPTGNAMWEMGCDQRPRGKANDDYKKRTAEISPEDRAESTFVFVTPRLWSQKDKWREEVLARNEWRNVLVWDAVDIATWLEEAPATQIWLAEHLGIRGIGQHSPEDWYAGWASASSPSIPMTLVGSRRGSVSETLIQKLRDCERTVPVVADSRAEAIAFVIASLSLAGADDLLDRMLIISRPDVVPAAGRGGKPILLLDLQHNQEPAIGDKNRFQIIRPIAKGQFALRDSLELPHVASQQFTQSLEEAGLSYHKARALALDAGHSVTVLRRILSDDPGIKSPHWASNAEEARKTLPHALVGGWTEGEATDDITFVSLLTDTPTEEISQHSQELSIGDDAPLARIGNVTITVSQLDVLFAVGPYIQTNDLNNFLTLCLDALGERDPKLDLPENEWWLANIHGKSLRYSPALLSGIRDTLGILAVHGNVICGKRLGINLAARIGNLVTNLLTNMTEDSWLSIRPHLRSLAEAAPPVFLTCIEEDLNRESPTITTLMRTIGDGFMSQTCLRTELLWALETLAWPPQYFARVAEIVFRLCAYQPVDNYSNTPQNTARDLFRDWLQSTNLLVEERMLVLRRLAPKYRDCAIDICKSLLAHGPRHASTPLRPRWLNLEGDDVQATNHDYWKARREASSLLLDLAPFSNNELHSLISAIEVLHPEDAKRLLEEIQRWSGTANDEEKLRLATPLRQASNDLKRRLSRQQPGDQESDHLHILKSLLQEAQEAISPQDLRHEHLWLFETGYISWPELDQDEMDEKITYQERETLVRKRRHEALLQIKDAYGEDELYRFVLGLKNPSLAAQLLVGFGAPEEQVTRWAARSLAEPEREVSLKILPEALAIGDETRLEQIISRLENAGLFKDDEALIRLALSLPRVRSGWLMAEKLDGVVSATYWQNVHAYIPPDATDGDADFVVKRLIAAERPYTACAAVRFDLEKLAPELWLYLLEQMATTREENAQLPETWHLTQIFKFLDACDQISDAQIARVELPFAKGLRSYGDQGERPLWASHRLIMQDPSHYVNLLRWCFSRKDRMPEPDFSDIDKEQLELRAELAFNVLEEWSELPGVQSDGSFDEAHFVLWCEQMLKIAAEHDRRYPALSRFAECLARAAKHRGFEDWLPTAVLDLLDRSDLRDLREAFEIGIFNARGVTTRWAYDGGQQEREIAKTYRGLGLRYANSHPRVGAMLEGVAQEYERDGQRQDNQAELGERWHH